MDDLWKQVLAELEIEVSKPVFFTYFKPTSLISIEKSVATIDASTGIAASEIEKRYYALIKKILDKKTGENISIVFTSTGVGNKKTPKTESPLFASEVVRSQIRNRPARIRPDYTFDSLAVSDSNQLAYTASLTVSTNPGEKYNPLFLHGSVGVGKTHLMNAIANKAFDERNDYGVIYLTTEEFTNEVVEAIKEKNTSELRRKFRNVDLLLLDDIQFLAGKEKVQEELFHTFNTLIDRGSQIVFSSDRPPSELKKIEARLASRFEGGLSIDIEPPDFELRSAILLIKSAKYGINLTLDAAKLIAEKIEDTRALEGFLLKLASTKNGELGEVDESRILPLLAKNRQDRPIFRPDSIIDAICSFYNIKTTQLKGERRDSHLVRPRHVCMFLLKNEAKLTFSEIGNLIGGRDHSTVMHAVEKIGKSLENSSNVREEISFIKRRIKEDYVH